MQKPAIAQASQCRIVVSTSGPELWTCDLWTLPLRAIGRYPRVLTRDLTGGFGGDPVEFFASLWHPISVGSDNLNLSLHVF